MKIFFIITALSLLPTISFAQDVDKIHQLLNADSQFDRLKKAASGDKEKAVEEVSGLVRVFCDKTKSCGKAPSREEVAVELAKRKLKTIELANRKYAEALVDFNKIITSCNQEASAMFSKEYAESCSDAFVCKGEKAVKLWEFFKDFMAFEKQIETTHRELSSEEKMVLGVDISPMLKMPIGPRSMSDKNIDAAHPKFAMAQILHIGNSNLIEKKLFTTEPRKEEIRSVRFDDNYIPKGIMTLRALNCESEKISKGGKVKEYDLACNLYVGNTKVDVFAQEKMKSCTKKDSKDSKDSFFSFKNLFKKKSDSKNVNDTERSEIKNVETKEPEKKSIQASEQ